MLKKIYVIVVVLIVWNTATAQELWSISTQQQENYIPTCVANGRIGIVPDAELFHVREVVLNHVFDRAGAYDISRVVSGINPFDLELAIDGEVLNLEGSKDWEQRLDMKTAALHTNFEWQKKAEIHSSIQALRNMPYAGMVKVDIKADKDLTLRVSNIIRTSGDFQEVQSLYRMLRDLDARMPVFQTRAKSRFGAHDVAAASGFVFEDERPELSSDVSNPHEARMSFEIPLKKGQTYTFSLVGSVCTTRDFSDPFGESERFVVFAQREGAETILKRHQKAWDQLWESDIIIEGDDESQRDVRFALYNLYSYIRSDSDLSLSPMGLSAPGYNGHVFWDSELWMYPSLLLLQPEMAEGMMQYRYDRMEPARAKARNFGFQGTMYPWESDDSGEEATPTWCLTGTFEQHITADVGIAAWNYFRLTKDEEWLREIGWPILKEVAEFWESRAELNEDKTYSINNVVGANEFAHGANDNAFTNGSVKVVMADAVKAANIVGAKVPESWTDISDNLRIHTFENGVTREHSEYKGEIIKQADVNLLAYPLKVVKDEQTMRKDLEYYEDKISPEGPAMTFSVFSVIYSRLGDQEKAFEMFKRGYVPNKRAPFGVLAESATSNNPYFATGAGGMLQAVLYGFAGLDLTDEGLQQGKPCMPKHWKSLTITGLGPDKETIKIER